MVQKGKIHADRQQHGEGQLLLRPLRLYRNRRAYSLFHKVCYADENHLKKYQRGNDRSRSDDAVFPGSSAPFVVWFFCCNTACASCSGVLELYLLQQRNQKRICYEKAARQKGILQNDLDRTCDRSCYHRYDHVRMRFGGSWHICFCNTGHSTSSGLRITYFAVLGGTP